MGILPVLAKTVGPRTRRWDVVIVGSGLTALVTAARLGMAGQRVLVVEESAARDAFPGLREPFFCAGLRDPGVLASNLRELGVPLIERRRLEPCACAFQVVAPNLRAEIGTEDLTGEELELWGLATRAESKPILRALERASEAERKAMLDSPLVYLGRRGRQRANPVDAYGRGLPAEVQSAPEPLASLLDIQVRALSNLASRRPSSEARARLLGSVLAGGIRLPQGPPWLHGLLRRRVDAHFGEFRSPQGGFQLVSAGGQPGVALCETGELWLGRSLVIACPGSALARSLDQQPIPDFLAEPRTFCRRVQIHLRAPSRAIPEGMGQRLILLGETHPQADFERAPAADLSLGAIVTLSVFAGASAGGECDLVASTVVGADEAIPGIEEQLESQVRGLFPFENGSLTRCETHRPEWDDDGWLEDPPGHLGWPTQVPLQVSSRPSVYRLDRAEVAGLGLEGDLLLGWRAGDAIAQELS